MKLNSVEECDNIISLFFKHSEFQNKKDIKIFKNNSEIHQEEFEASKKEEQKEEKIEENMKFVKENPLNLLIINEKVLLSNQITMENVPDSLDKEKIFEIFFIYGDILEIVLKKEEVKSKIFFP
jgi:hypothetical protein